MARIVLQLREGGHDPEILRRLEDFFDAETGSGPAECAPPLDVVEHGDRVVILMDVPGVAADALRVVFADGNIIVAGRKTPRVCEHSVAFHLAERSFGRFVRAVRLTGAFDVAGATASLRAGELRIVLPRIEERRGGDIAIEVTGG